MRVRKVVLCVFVLVVLLFTSLARAAESYEVTIERAVAAKMRDGKASVALYAVSSDVEGARLAKVVEALANKAIVGMLGSSCEPLSKDPQLVASILQGAMSGVSRRLLESGAREKDFRELREELVLFARSYLRACAGR